jgi:RNA polymerase sigma-70 factor (ECF subfamily)
VVQKALVRGHVAFAQFRGTTAREFLAWLVRIVQNVARNTIRDEHAPPRDVRRDSPLPENADGEPQLSADSSTPSRKAGRSEETARVIAAVERLPQPEREVVRLHGLEELSYESVAEKLGTTKERVRGAWERGIALLGRQLRKQ